PTACGDMSIPTMRTPRSPFARSARRSAAVPGAPDAVTRTVMSRISRAMLLRCSQPWVDARVDELEEGLDVEPQPERGPERHSVRDHVDEVDDRLERDVVTDSAVSLPRLE